MRIYNRNNRSHVRYYLRLLRTDLTPIDYWTLAMALTLLCFVILWPAAASAQDDPCDACIADWSWAECPCLPEAPEPISSLACIPQTHAIDGILAGLSDIFLAVFLLALLATGIVHVLERLL